MILYSGKSAVISVVMCMLFISTQCTPHDKETLKNPTKYPSECGNKETSLICNPEKILSETEVLSLNSSIAAISNGTRCPCDECFHGNYVFGVAVVKNIAITTGSVESSMEALAGELLSRWQPGDCRNDAVILLVTEQKKLFTSPGSKMSERISAACFHDSYELIRDDLRDENWARGLERLIQEYSEMIPTGCHKATDPGNPYTTYVIIGVVMGSLILLFICFWCCCVFVRTRRMGRGVL